MRQLLLDAPGKNALSSELMRSLRDQLRSAAGEPLLMTGAGDAFSAGLNLNEVRAFDLDGARTFIELLEALVVELYEYPGPLVALVNGHAIAGGCVMAMCCDHRVMSASESARIGLNETALGLPFPPRVLELARRRLAPPHRDRVLFGAQLHDARSALELGLVDEIASNADDLARERLTALAAHPPSAYRFNKRALRAGTLDPSPKAIDAFEREGLPRWISTEVKHTVSALLEGRRNRSR